MNGVNIESMRHAEVVAFIKNGGNETHLLVVDPDTDEHFKKMGITPTSIHVKGRVKDFNEKSSPKNLKIKQQVFEICFIAYNEYTICMWIKSDIYDIQFWLTFNLVKTHLLLNDHQ